MLIDQLPVLAELRRAMEELAVMEPPAPEPSVVLEQLPEIRDSLLKTNKGKWQDIAEQQKSTVYSNDPSVLQAQAKR